MSKLIDMTGQIIGHWQVLERAPSRSGGRTCWKCKCLLCNKTIKEISGQNLRSGQSKSCGCTKMEKMRLASIKDETGKIYGHLKVIRMATKEETPRKDRTGIYWVCECLNCGNKKFIAFGDYLRNGDTISCGCILSKNESKISKMLNDEGIKYKRQYSFKDLTSTGRLCDCLLYDFGIIDNNDKLLYLIEFDGIQHFLSEHARSLQGFEATQRNDHLKNEYCFKNNIPLIRIPYNKNYCLEDLKLETTKFLIAPENVENYYKNKEEKLKK